MLEAILFAHEEIKKIVAFIEEITSAVGKEKMEVELHKVDEEVETAVRNFATDKMKEAVRTVEKLERQEKMDAVREETLSHFEELLEEYGSDIEEVLQAIIKESVRMLITHERSKTR